MQEVSIVDQIRDADFMFPARRWASISEAGVSVIQRLLVVRLAARWSCDVVNPSSGLHDAEPCRRYTVDQALADPWLEGDTQVAADLARLERETGAQWLTSV